MLTMGNTHSYELENKVREPLSRYISLNLIFVEPN